MKAKDLLRNAIVLKTQGQKGLSDRLTSLVRDIEFKGLSTLAAYVMALVDNERDPVVGLMRQASTDEMVRKKLLGNAILKMSTFNKVLNMRFAVPGTLLMDADDPALADIVAVLPPKLIKDVRFKNPHLDRFDEVLTATFRWSATWKACRSTPRIITSTSALKPSSTTRLDRARTTIPSRGWPFCGMSSRTSVPIHFDLKARMACASPH
ncbi:hypothetical protein DV532_25565 (plasmid) [Pseudomonas sp. Leaf58]|uniref:hypothetical protein n=1 Tax=Pseudomonas sp. Leaf58 TaxID=1736226 RepID=UPI000EA886EC|nr:hypothetical protein [Pseudomonas sp. Leaf58]AYG47667.1 hypothetical protein DV532_25565 [Pseudomonas sp. Leaf58]